MLPRGRKSFIVGQLHIEDSFLEFGWRCSFSKVIDAYLEEDIGDFLWVRFWDGVDGLFCCVSVKLDCRGFGFKLLHIQLFAVRVRNDKDFWSPVTFGGCCHFFGRFFKI